MATSPINGLVTPADTDSPNITFMSVLADALDTRVLPVLTEAYRDANYPTSVEGALVYIRDDSSIQLYTGSEWIDRSTVYQFGSGTQRITDTTFTDITGMAVPVVAGTDYYFRMGIYYSSHTSNDSRFIFTAPSVTYGRYMVSPVPANVNDGIAFTTQTTWSTTGSDQLVEILGCVEASTTGTIQLQMSKFSNTDTATDLVVNLAYSYLIVKEVM